MSRSSEHVRIPEATLIRQTEKAGLFEIEDEEIWLPWSQVEDSGPAKNGDTGPLYVPRWLAEKNHLHYEEA